ncbi:MAG: primosomal protein N' [Schleiferiaceae bacterium]
MQQTFTYAVHGWEEECAVGKRVIVQFGKRRFYAGIIESLHQTPPDYSIKPIVEVLDDEPTVNPTSIEFWKWVASYYMCSLGEVMNAALPSPLKLESETVISAVDDVEIPWNDLSDSEFLAMEALGGHPRIRVSELGNLTGEKSPMKIVNKLLDRGVIYTEEDLKKNVKPKTERWICLHPSLTHEIIQEVFKTLKRAPKQEAAFTEYFAAVEDSGEDWVRLTDITKNPDISRAHVLPLIKKELFVEEERDVDPWGGMPPLETPNLSFSELQSKALSDLDVAFAENKVAVLHGVTGSGKTEIYIQKIQEVLEKGESALYLLPEIALTTQLVQRLRKYFGERVVVYHSKISPRERLNAWNQVRTQKDNPCVVIGARSSIFLPFTNLGLVVVDEEHDPSYKQSDPAPRYNGRDSAIVLSRMHRASIVLGSATPSLESVYNAQEKKYAWVSLPERFGGVELPEMEIVDIQKEHKMKLMTEQFSRRLLEEIREAKAANKRVILFQNRRGFAPTHECQTCGHTPQCKNCDISLTFHKYTHSLHCHYCGYSEPIAKRCNQCGSYDLELKGFGTEKIEDSLLAIEPSLRIQRLDLDSTRRKGDIQTIMDDFENGEIDVLVGTQMVTKGLDFDNVALVGVMNADSLLHFPDFRAFERSYQMLSQVAGRAGRRDERGKVLIQTFSPFHTIVQQVANQQFEAMVKDQLYERKNYKYPPYYKLIELTLKHRDSKLVSQASEAYAKALREVLGDRVLGPEFAPIPRLKGQYNKKIWIKFEKALNYHQVKTAIQKLADHYFTQPPFARVRLVINVDPA